MKRILVIFLAIAVLFPSCTKKKKVIGPESGKEVEFTAAVENYSTTKATESAFDAGDLVRIIAGYPINQTTVGSISGAKILLREPLRWRVKQAEPTTFAAVYQTGGAVQATPSLTYDLLSGGKHDYEAHRLFLSAVYTATPSEPVNFKFKHPFSKVVLNITNDVAIEKVEIKDVVMKGTVNMEDQTLEISKSKESFEAYKLSARSYAAVVMPQVADPEIVVTTSGGKTYTCRLDAPITLEAGYAYSADLTLTPDAATFSFTVVPWADGGALDYEPVTD